MLGTGTSPSREIKEREAARQTIYFKGRRMGPQSCRPSPPTWAK